MGAKEKSPDTINKALHFFIRFPLHGRSGDYALLSMQRIFMFVCEVKRVQR